MVNGLWLMVRNKSEDKRSGQALSELCVCMVALVAVLAGLLQLTKITMMQTETMTEARAEAASAAMSDSSLMPSVPYIKTWKEAADQTRYTADDESVGANGASFFDTMPDRAVSDASEWNVFKDGQNPFITMHSSRGIPSSYFGLVKGDASATTNVLKAFRSLIYDNDSITINSEVWMTWTKGIY